MIFSRRSIQAKLDAVGPSISKEAHQDFVQRLNAPVRDRLAAMYELMVLYALLEQGAVELEVEQQTGKKPDITFKNKKIEFIADVTSVSDRGLDEINPYEELSQLVENLKNKLKLPIGGVDIKIRSFKERKGSDNQTKLRIPARKKLAEFFKERIEPEIREQNRTGGLPIRVEIDDEVAGLTVEIDPAKGPYSSGGYASYDRPTIRDRNPFYKALRSKAKQLKGIDGITGIIVCDAHCATMAGQVLGGPKELSVDLTNDFLGRNSSVDFVFLISVRENQVAWYNPQDRTRRVHGTLLTQANFKHHDDLDELFQEMLSRFPKPISMPINAARQAVRSDYGWGHHGGFRMSGQTFRLSSRMIMEVLSGKISVERMEEIQKTNPFKMPFTNGKLPETIQVIKGSEDDSDDWIEFNFSESDPAITPFK